jgi:hypothetical protein
VGKNIEATDEFVYEENGKLKLYGAFEGVIRRKLDRRT